MHIQSEPSQQASRQTCICRKDNMCTFNQNQVITHLVQQIYVGKITCAHSVKTRPTRILSINICRKVSLCTFSEDQVNIHLVQQSYVEKVASTHSANTSSLAVFVQQANVEKVACAHSFKTRSTNISSNRNM